MTKSTLTTKGFEEYLEKLAKAGADIDAVADQALTAGAQVLVDGMRRRAPVLTGKLKSHIMATGIMRDGNEHWVKVGIHMGDLDPDQEMYFIYQEYGSARKPAHPYVRPTFDEDMRAARAAMLDVFKRAGAL